MYFLLAMFLEWYGIEVKEGRRSSLTGVEISTLRLFRDWTIENFPDLHEQAQSQLAGRDND